jgi:hypothetical protein
MTYGRAICAGKMLDVEGAPVSHRAELVRGDFLSRGEGPLIRPFGAPSPQGEKGEAASASGFP